MVKYELLEESYSYDDDSQVIFEEEEVIYWGEQLAEKIKGESEDDYPDNPKNIEQAIEVLESANEFFIKK